MKKSLLTVAAAVLCVAALPRARAAAAPSPRPILATVDTRQVSRPISPYPYGMFIEHIGPLVYRSLWSEMLDDRKFYYAISSRAAPAPAGPRFLRMMALRRWQPVGPDALVTMDTRDPFVGLHSPRIELGATSAHGIRQSGLALVKGKRYTGYIYLKGGPAARVSVTLTWGHAARDRAAAQFSGLTHGYERVPFSFTAGADTARGALEITGTGSG
ncbi:MAG TPA: hypothetical protein VND24_02685, partial [Steroidobacteraceae bacterium]|nr:hypothetical protein [Steroidobacteraceae bacterium]